MMELLVNRTWQSSASIIGCLYVNGEFQCYTLERPAVAIPLGVYPVVLRESLRFHQLMPWVENVPGRAAIEIHWGNFPSNTEGCILVGQTRGEDVVGESVAAFAQLYPQIQTALAGGDSVRLTIAAN